MIPFDETKYPISKRVGVVTEVTLITPIKAGRVEGEYRTYRKRLQDVLDDVQRRELQRLPTPVDLIRQIHFARWVIIDRPSRRRGASIHLEFRWRNEVLFSQLRP